MAQTWSLFFCAGKFQKQRGRLKSQNDFFCTFAKRNCSGAAMRPLPMKNDAIMKKSNIVLLTVILVLLIDQATKIWVKTNMHLNEEFGLFGLSWARIHFIENEGMAFGWELGGAYGKLALSLFRVVVVSFLAYYLAKLVKDNAKTGLLVCFSLILAGALGNIIDSAFYGLLFSPPNGLGYAQMFPPEGGYAGFLHGKVVDMLHFPLFRGMLPDWMPLWGGEYAEFFRPVFNVADSSITIGVISLLLFQRSFFSDSPKAPMETAASQPAPLTADSPAEDAAGL
jgi:signal peptidase II